MNKILMLIIFLFFSTMAWAGEDTLVYRKAFAEAKRGENDFAFMHYRAITTDYPQSRYLSDALFAQGEYSVLTNNYQGIQSFFKEYLLKTPTSEKRIFALAYLFALAKDHADTIHEKKYIDEILNLKKHNFVFEKTKIYKYRSPLNKFYKAVYSIDKIEITVDNELLATVSYTN